MGLTLTVYFDDPFWVGVFERTEEGRLSVCKVTFGAEPTDREVWEYVLRQYHALRFSPAVETDARKSADNPKRRQRNAKKELTSSGVGTKAQQALQRQREAMKTERRLISRKQREAEERRLFELKRQKKKEKHKGR